MPMTPGRDVQPGDDVYFLGKPHRITRIVPYTHPVVTRDQVWMIAYSDDPAGVYLNAWGITLELEALYETGAQL